MAHLVFFPWRSLMSELLTLDHRFFYLLRFRNCISEFSAVKKTRLGCVGLFGKYTSYP